MRPKEADVRTELPQAAAGQTKGKRVKQAICVLGSPESWAEALGDDHN